MAESSVSDPVVISGHIAALRLFDIAYAIDLSRAEALWVGRAARRTRLVVTPPKAMSFGTAPLHLGLDPVRIELPAGETSLEASARLYDFGAITLTLRLPVERLAWADYVALLNAVAAAAEKAPWQALLAAVRETIAGALDRPNTTELHEDYLLGGVQRFDTELDAATLLDRLDLVPLLSGEHRPLSHGARTDLLRHRYSYYEDDLVVLTWDRAFLFDPRGDSDVADVLEVANAQLLEMRYYNELLDDELPRMYDMVEAARRGVNFLAARRYAGLARRLYTLVAEVTELTERVDNALQVTEDVYLARVYAAALELFRVRATSAAVDRKLAIMRDTYGALYEEASGTRGELMEAAIVLLIVMEVALAFWRR
jgi:hypothetical protein